MLPIFQTSTTVTTTYVNPALQVVESPVVIAVAVILIVGVIFGVLERLGWLEGAKEWGRRKHDWELPI